MFLLLLQPRSFVASQGNPTLLPHHNHNLPSSRHRRTLQQHLHLPVSLSLPSPSLAHNFPRQSIIINLRTLDEKTGRISKSASIHVTSRTAFVQPERLIPVKVYYIFAIQSANILHGHQPAAYPKLSCRFNLGL